MPIFVILYVVFVKLKFIVIQSVSIFIVNILLFLLNQFFAIVMFDCVAYFCGVLCFYTNAGWGINQAKNVIIKFLSGAVIPISFFPEVLQKIINVLPFSGFVSNPVSILLMKNSFAESIEISLKNFAWMILLELVAKIVFNHASKKVTVQGG